MRCDQGFSLIEILLSTILLTALAVGLMSSFTNLKQGTLRQTDRLYVNALLQQKMTELKAGYNKNGVLREVIASDPEATVLDFQIGTNSKLTIDAERKDGGNDALPGGLRFVQVSLTGTDKNGKDQAPVKMKSFFYKE